MYIFNYYLNYTFNQKIENLDYVIVYYNYI